jgi:hypothetical protein
MIQNVSRATPMHVLSNNHQQPHRRWVVFRREETAQGKAQRALEDLPVLSYWTHHAFCYIPEISVENECADLAVLLKYPAESAGW